MTLGERLILLGLGFLLAMVFRSVLPEDWTWGVGALLLIAGAWLDAERTDSVDLTNWGGCGGTRGCG